MDAPVKASSVLERIGEVIWAAALICLPITSFPLFSSLTGALVAPLSILPFFILLLVWSLPMLIRKGEIPKESIPLGIFTLSIVLSCAAAFFIDIPGFKGKTISAQELRALFTLAIGLVFYLVTTTWVKTIDQLKATWKYVSIGGIISLLWTAFQAFYILRHAEVYPSWLDQAQSWFSVLSPSFSPGLGRVNGLTYEASWFAHQMVMVYLPIWIAASYNGSSAFKLRIKGITIENILLVFGLAAFFMSTPRIGLISFLLMVVYLFVRLNLAFYRRFIQALSSWGLFRRVKSPAVDKISRGAVASVLIAAVYVLFIAGVFFFASQRDWRLSILVNDPPTIKEVIGALTLDQNTMLELSNRFIFMERVVYWLNGWNVFNQYPWLGVGLGNAGFFFPKLAPAIGWATYEIRNVLFYLPQLPNVKSFWFRLLAEGGLVGFSLFITWLYILFRSSRYSQHAQDPAIKTFALAGQLALLAFIGEGFSIDSFAMPYLWVIAGLAAAVAMIARRDDSQSLHASKHPVMNHGNKAE